jgi:hypothetical protein
MKNRLPRAKVVVGWALIALGSFALVASFDASSLHAAVAGEHSRQHRHEDRVRQISIDDDEIEAILEDALEGLGDLEMLDGLDEMLEALSDNLEGAFEDMDFHLRLDGDPRFVVGHGRDRLHYEFPEGFDAAEFERHMDKVMHKVERQVRRSTRHLDRDLGEEGLRREIEVLERQLQRLQSELEDLREDEEI